MVKKKSLRRLRALSPARLTLTLQVAVLMPASYTCTTVSRLVRFECMKKRAKWRAASAQVVVERTDLCAELDGGKVELSSGRRFE